MSSCAPFRAISLIVLPLKKRKQQQVQVWSSSVSVLSSPNGILVQPETPTSEPNTPQFRHLGVPVAGETAARTQALGPDYAATDNLVQAPTGQYRRAALDAVGRAALRLGLDYPALRHRLNQAALARDRPATAIGHYGRARPVLPRYREGPGSKQNHWEWENLYSPTF